MKINLRAQVQKLLLFQLLCCVDLEIFFVLCDNKLNIFGFWTFGVTKVGLQLPISLFDK